MSVARWHVHSSICLIIDHKDVPWEFPFDPVYRRCQQANTTSIQYNKP